MTTRNCKVLVIGAGPGGYVAAIRAGQLGLDTMIVEGDRAGGTCLIRGCIPSKALIHAATVFDDLSKHSSKTGHMGISIKSKPKLDMPDLISWKDTIVGKLNKGVEHLLKKAGVELIKGWASFKDAKTCTVTTSKGDLEIRAEHVILANGSESIELPFMPYDKHVISSTGALDLDKLPKQLAIIGGGYIGLELGIAFSKMGTEVTVIEALDRILPLFDKELVRPVSLWLKRHKINVHLSSKAEGVERKGRKSIVTFSDSKGKKHKLSTDKVLVTVGRQPRTNGWGLENMGVDMDGNFIKVDNRCQTTMRNVWAIGDIVGEPMLAHKASAQGEMVAELIAGEKRSFDPVAIPSVCFTEPEIVSVGLSPNEAEEEGIETVVGKFPFAASGRALAMDAGSDGGFVRITARKDNHLVLGIQAVGAHVSELSGEFISSMEMGAVLEDISGTIHVHPTLTEAFHEAALASLGHAIHISK